MIDVGRKPQFKNVISLTPLVDVIFMLIIFFLFGGTITLPDPYEIDLPTVAIDEITPPSTVVVDVSGFGELALNGEASSRESLQRQVSTWLIESPDLEVIVRADAAATTGDLLATLRVLSTAGVVSLRLATRSVATSS